MASGAPDGPLIGSGRAARVCQPGPDRVPQRSRSNGHDGPPVRTGAVRRRPESDHGLAGSYYCGV